MFINKSNVNANTTVHNGVIAYCTTIGGGCQSLTLMLDTSNSGYVCKLDT